ncbi:MAG: hypothetical protein C5B52_09235 [Bacteroidetes bacterium]|nr:MAG: hypothetical protein C5B52_09235 [Bacteroidota bacterium]
MHSPGAIRIADSFTMFVISKIVGFFLHPMLWIVIVFVWALLTKNQIRKKKLFKTGALLLIFFSNPFIIDRLTLAYQPKPYHLAPGEKYSVGILLGGLSGYDTKTREGFFSYASDRFIQTERLYKGGRIDKILISGGSGSLLQGKAFREADFLREQLLQVGIPDSAILIERNSRNTVENAIFSKKILDSLQLPGPYLLISSAMHLTRAGKIFRKQGLAIQNYPCAFTIRESGGNFIEDYIFPSSGSIDEWDEYLKEVVGLITYKILGKA